VGLEDVCLRTKARRLGRSLIAAAFCSEDFRRGCWFARSLELATPRALFPCVCRDPGGSGVVEVASDSRLSVAPAIMESVCWVACWGRAAEARVASLWWRACVAEVVAAYPFLKLLSHCSADALLGVSAEVLAYVCEAPMHVVLSVWQGCHLMAIDTSVASWVGVHDR
jgi:hypothetical protein